MFIGTSPVTTQLRLIFWFIFSQPRCAELIQIIPVPQRGASAAGFCAGQIIL